MYLPWPDRALRQVAAGQHVRERRRVRAGDLDDPLDRHVPHGHVVEQRPVLLDRVGVVARQVHVVVDVVGAAAGLQRLLEERRAAVPRPEVERRGLGRGRGRERAGHAAGSSWLAWRRATPRGVGCGGVRRSRAAREHGLGRDRDDRQVRLVDQAGPDDRAQLGVDGRVGLELAVRRQPPVDLVAGALVGVLAARPAATPRGCRGRRSRWAGTARSASGPSCAAAMIRCWSAISWSISAPTGRSSSGLTSRTKRSAWPHISSSKTSLGRLNTSRKSSIPGPDTELTPASAAMQRAAERLGAGLRVEDRAVRQGHVRLASAGRATWRPRRRPRRAGAPRSPTSASWRSSCGTSPARRRTGPARPGRMIWAIVIPASTSTVWKTVAPTMRHRAR